MKKSFRFFLILCLIFVLGCHKKEKPYCVQPPDTFDIDRQINRPGFWISRNLFADKVILNLEEIAAFNSKTEKELKGIKDVLKIGPAYSGKELRASLRGELEDILKQKLYSKDAKIIGRNFFSQIEKEANLGAIPAKINVRYGFISGYAEQRVLPTEEILTKKPGDIDFDELQNSSLDIGMPLAILHESAEGSWVYALSATSSGWVKKSNVAFCDFAALKDFLEKTQFIIVINKKADIFLDPGLTQLFDRVRMGAKFPYGEDFNPGIVKILIPSRTKEGKFIERVAYLKKADVNLGYLTYTPRNVIQQAFKLLNAPYSWGGKGGEQDCSGFIQEVFFTVGVILPRNSSKQGKTGESLGRILNEKAVGGITILQLEGHILLYLGAFENKFFAIHDTYGYSQKQENGPDIFQKINQVVVSELSLGKGSKKGSLLERIISIRRIN
jgi:hypothetical protein